MPLNEKLEVQGKVPKPIVKALEKFFKLHPGMEEGCKLIAGFDGTKAALIIEESQLYHELNYGESEVAADIRATGGKVEMWKIHTEFLNLWKGTGYTMEMLNNCAVGFYED